MVGWSTSGPDASSCNFAPAEKGEGWVFGANAPEVGPQVADADQRALQWIAFMKSRGIGRVCCLLDPSALRRWTGTGLIELYRQELGAEAVLHAPIGDYATCDTDLFLGTILPFLEAVERSGEKTVVHCMAGFGRTGQVLAAWLIAARGLGVADAVERVTKAGASRDPLQASVVKGLEFLRAVQAARASRVGGVP